MMLLDWLKPLRECNPLPCGSPSKTAMRPPEDLDEVLVLEPKVVSAMMRLQQSEKGDGLGPQQIVEFLSTKHGHLDGDIESQVITALQSGIRKGFICGLCNGRYAFIGPNPRKMAAQCYNKVKHGPKCTCYLITAGKRRCCSFKYDSHCLFVKNPEAKKKRSRKRFAGRGKKGSDGESCTSPPRIITVTDNCTQCQKKKVSFCSPPSVDLTGR